jgi:transposase-like protein
MLDATFPKVHEAGTVESQALMIALGVDENGVREILGFDISQNESGAGWEQFLFSLLDRGLKNVKLVISDAHAGLKSAIAKAFVGAKWQRCVVYCERNILAEVKKKDKGFVAAKLKPIFLCPNKASAVKELDRVVEELSPKFPKAMQILDDAKDEILAFYDFFKSNKESDSSSLTQEESDERRKHISPQMSSNGLTKRLNGVLTSL